MNYRLTIYPAMEITNTRLEYHYDTADKMLCAQDIAANLLLFIQDKLGVMDDYTNCFLMEEKVDGDWQEYETDEH